jgi:hypothetical protein
MATPPDFTAGQILTAAQMNAVGLWLVKAQTIGSAVSSVQVTSAFSADYDNYRIIVSGGAASGSEAIRLQLGSTTTGYYGFLSYGSYAGTSNFGANDNNANYFSFAGAYETNNIVCCFDLLAPYLTEATEIRSSVRYSTVYGNYVGGLGDATSYTAFTLTPAGAHTWTGGTIRVYGYRN